MATRGSLPHASPRPWAVRQRARRSTYGARNEAEPAARSNTQKPCPSSRGRTGDIRLGRTARMMSTSDPQRRMLFWADAPHQTEDRDFHETRTVSVHGVADLVSHGH